MCLLVEGANYFYDFLRNEIEVFLLLIIILILNVVKTGSTYII